MDIETLGTHSENVREWLDRFAACVRARDFDGGRALCSLEVHGFGSLAEVAVGRQSLHDEQWHPTWLRTRGFQFDATSLRVLMSPDGHQAVVTTLWASEGVDSPADWPSQTPYERHGRATIVLQRQPSGSWLAVHTHFSLTPELEKGSRT